MTRKESLTAVLAKVEAGGDVRPSTFKVLRDPDNAACAVRAHKGSIDAAKALHEVVLPGWEWHLGPSNAKVYPYNGSPTTSWGGMAENPARAWLLAILCALHAREPDT